MLTVVVLLLMKSDDLIDFSVTKQNLKFFHINTEYNTTKYVFLFLNSGRVFHKKSIHVVSYADINF